MSLEEGDLVLCTVDRIVGTVVFVKIHGSKELEGSIVMSEIAPGRIRNLRDYVFPNKKIVCKVLRINKEENIELTLRRVTQKETKQVLEQFNLEKKYRSLLKTILNENADKIIYEIEKNSTLLSFIEEAKKDSSKFKKYFSKEDSERILNILNSEKQKKSQIRKEINLKTTKPDGIILIKNILGNLKDIEVSYIASGKYSLKIESKDLKKADHKLQEAINEIELKSKKAGLEFSEIKK